MSPEQVALAACEELGLEEGVLRGYLLNSATASILERHDEFTPGGVYYLVFIPRDMEVRDALLELPKVSDLAEKL